MVQISFRRALFSTWIFRGELVALVVNIVGHIAWFIRHGRNNRNVLRQVIAQERCRLLITQLVVTAWEYIFRTNQEDNICIATVRRVRGFPRRFIGISCVTNGRLVWIL